MIRLKPLRTGVLCVVATLFWVAQCSTCEAQTDQPKTCERWGRFELQLAGPSHGNPFLEVELSATFRQADIQFRVTGFYDGDGTYRVRFSPPEPGTWTYETESNNEALVQQTGKLQVTEPSADNHGPVEVAHQFHFAYADGTPYKPLGTTCYAWTSQPEQLQQQTLKTLATAPFNKVRMCVFPKNYRWNENDPPRYAFEGTPPQDWDFSRFHPAFFKHLEKRIDQLGNLGIQADLILLHPYDRGRWGFDRMSDEQDDRYLRYLVSRLASFRNVWWSLANEWDFVTHKEESDWDRMIQVVSDADPFGRLIGIHNGFKIYDHNNPRLTHASIQNGSAAEDAGRASLYRDVFRKPIVLDEVKYEGDIPKRWGNLSAKEMVHRCWQSTIAGCYVTHGECYLSDDDVLWWSKGGVLKGESPARIDFLRTVLSSSPASGLNLIDKWQQTNVCGKPGEYYLIYFGNEELDNWEFSLPRQGLKDGMKFNVEILDTWNMTTTAVKTTFVAKRQNDYVFKDSGGRSIDLPGKPYMALRIRRLTGGDTLPGH